MDAINCTACSIRKEKKASYARAYRQRPKVKEKQRIFAKTASSYALANLNYWTKEYQRRKQQELITNKDGL